MSEQTKTLIFTGVALAALTLALTTRPRVAADISQVAFNSTLNEADPLAAKRLRIVKFNEETASLASFEVAEIDGVWSIPSHQGYPADAEEQMADAAVGVMNLQVLGVPAIDASTHASYGVIEPDVEKLTAGATGVGTRVTMQDEKGDRLVDMIIGLEVKDQPGQRYVREVGRDPVYMVKIDPSKLSTRFQDWIEEDLLKINTFDIRQVQIKDYTFEILFTGIELKPKWDRRSEMTLVYDESESKWSLDLLKVFDPKAGKNGDYVETQPSDDEELNNDAINSLKNALDDLKIVDVERKPEGLSENLRAEKEFTDHNEAQQSLAKRGFVLVGMPNNEFEMLSSEGEVICTMKDGVEYVLRFGQMAIGSDAADAEEGQAAASSNINRFIFVMARYNENILKQPQLEELPEVPAEETVAEETAETATEADGEKTTDEQAESTDEDDPSEKDAAIAAREATEKENQRKTDEYNDKVQKAKERVLELNIRFADWYYVISDSVYKKIHLGRSDVLKQKAPAEDDVLKQLDTLEGALPEIP